MLDYPFNYSCSFTFGGFLFVGKIEKLSRRYSAMNRLVEELEADALLNVPPPPEDDYKQFLKDIHPLPTNPSVLLSHPGCTQLVREQHAQQLQKYERIKIEYKLTQTAVETFHKLKEVYDEITILTQHHLLQMAGLSSVLSKVQTSAASLSPFLSEFLARFTFLGTDYKQSHWRKNFEVLLHEVAWPEAILSEKNHERAIKLGNQISSILKSFNFLPINYEARTSDNLKRLESKVLFETCIFQALDFIDENKLCDTQVSKIFISAENTLERVYMHFKDLFKRRNKRSGLRYFTLMPDFYFVSNDWNTAHLHHTLTGYVGLGKPEQAHLVDLMLTGVLRDDEAIHKIRPEMKRTIIDRVTKDNILAHWLSHEAPNSAVEENVTEWAQHLISFFSKTGNSANEAEYLISYYLLSFIKTYPSRFSKLLFENSEKSAIFDNKFELFQAGVRLHANVNWKIDYEYLFQLHKYEKVYITADISQKNADYYRLTSSECAQEYNKLKASMLAKENQELNAWVESNSILNYYDSLIKSPPSYLKWRNNLWLTEETRIGGPVSRWLCFYHTKCIFFLGISFSN
ncbi:hypothetical protein O181_067440 [Austropuccinia psidii MF-1]|uniref:Uncharacterized protein n=1 Tax=Austropuccinia psidii MF-1 TaxID=1389203 RepID=A0A9Q3I634_9BASI|nr:hypothetical protein [Austropuccinia psidii MF-1]